MRVTLPEQLADLVKRKLDSGLYGSSEEVIAAALELLELRDKKLVSLREDIQEGLASGAGRIFDDAVVEDIKRAGRERLAQRKKTG